MTDDEIQALRSACDHHDFSDDLANYTLVAWIPKLLDELLAYQLAFNWIRLEAEEVANMYCSPAVLDQCRATVEAANKRQKEGK